LRNSVPRAELQQVANIGNPLFIVVAHRLKHQGCASDTVDLTIAAWMPRSFGKIRGMRKRYRVLFFAALVAAFVVPVGFAWSIDSAQVRSAHVRRQAAATSSSAATLPSSVVIATPATDRSTGVLGVPEVPDAAKLLLVGTVLFGLAAFVRKAT
jgi:hypothetical protein